MNHILIYPSIWNSESILKNGDQLLLLVTKWLSLGFFNFNFLKQNIVHVWLKLDLKDSQVLLWSSETLSHQHLDGSGCSQRALWELVASSVPCRLEPFPGCDQPFTVIRPSSCPPVSLAEEVQRNRDSEGFSEFPEKAERVGQWRSQN